MLNKITFVIIPIFKSLGEDMVEVATLYFSGKQWSQAASSHFTNLPTLSAFSHRQLAA